MKSELNSTKEPKRNLTAVSGSFGTSTHRGTRSLLLGVLAIGLQLFNAGEGFGKPARTHEVSNDGVANFSEIARDMSPVPEWEGHGTPLWVHFTRERVKPGATESLLKLHTERAKAYAAAHWPRNSIVMRPLTGPEELWTFTGYNEVLAIGDENPILLEMRPELKARLAELDAQAASLITAKESNILKHIAGLSFQSDIEWSEFRVVTVRQRKIRQGMEARFAKWNHAKGQSFADLNIPVHMIVFKSLYGDEQGIFTQIIPYRSFRDMYLVSESSPDGRTTPEVSALLDGIIEWETLQAFYVEPSASYVTPEFARVEFARTMDPFWGVSIDQKVAGIDGVRQAVVMDNLPGKVSDGIKHLVGNGRLLRVEEVKRDGLTEYVVHYWGKSKYFADGKPAIYKVPDVVKKSVRLEDLPETLRTQVENEISVCLEYELNLRDGLDVPEYELVMMLPGRSNFLSKALIKDVIYDGSGKILAVETQVSLENVPEAARVRITQDIEGGELLNVQQLTKNGTIIYQSRVGKIGVVGADGRLVAQAAEVR